VHPIHLILLFHLLVLFQVLVLLLHKWQVRNTYVELEHPPHTLVNGTHCLSPVVVVVLYTDAQPL
jgi:hypothetical protein